MATLLTDTYESYGTGTGTLPAPYEVFAVLANVRVASGVAHAGSQAISMQATALLAGPALTADAINPAGSGGAFDVTAWGFRKTGIASGFGSDPGIVRGLSIVVGDDGNWGFRDTDVYVGFENPAGTLDLRFFSTYNADSITVVGIIIADTWQKFRIVGRLSSVTEGGSPSVNADGSCQVYVDDGLVISQTGLRMAATRSFGVNTWEGVWFQVNGYLDDIVVTNGTVVRRSMFRKAGSRTVDNL